jgi:hypothetical protein
MQTRFFKRRMIIALSIAMVLTTFLALYRDGIPASAQSGGGYDLTWNSIDGGGAMFSTGGNYSLGGTIGQADAGTMSGGSYTLAGGFWSGLVAWSNSTQFRIYLPVILKNH